MALIDVVKWEANEREFCWKYPSDNLRLGTQLVVYTAQTAFFVKGGKVLDEFTEGTYSLKSENLPLLDKVINIPFGGDSPFQAEVWYVNQISRLDMKWGTPQPLQLEDPKYGIMISVRAFGQYGFKVTNPRIFLESLIGNMSVFSAAAIDSYFKGRLISCLNTAIARKIVIDKIPILNINAYLTDLSEYCKKEVDSAFEKYGISLIDLSIMSINVPQDDPSLIQLRHAMSIRARMNVTGRDVYQMERSFDVFEKAAENRSNIAGPLMGLGMGMGIGNVMNNMASSSLNPNSQPVPPPIPQERTYYIYLNGQQMGGQTASQIAQMVMRGEANVDSLVWTSGMDTWAPIRSIQELANVCSPSVSSVPPRQNK